MNCEYFGVCGSCKLYDLSYDQQLEQKLSSVKELFSSLYKGTYDVAKSKDEHYRARSEFKLWHNDDDITYAMNRLDKQGVVMVDKCSMVNEATADLMRRSIKQITTRSMATKLFNIDFLSTSKGEIVVCLIYNI